MVSDLVQAIPVTSINAAGLGAFAAINPNGLPNPCFYIKIVNNSNVPVIISYDGVTDHDVIRANTDAPLNFQANSQPNNFRSLLPKGKIVYARGVAGVGTIYLIGYYQE